MQLTKMTKTNETLLYEAAYDLKTEPEPEAAEECDLVVRAIINLNLVEEEV